MGVILIDPASDEAIFDINFWHWRAIVEAIRSLHVLDDSRVEMLHQPFIGELTKDEARAVAAAMREKLLPTLAVGERVLLDGTRTMEPDDGTFYRTPEEQHKNYGTTREVLERFARSCESCSGFSVG